MSHSIKIKRVYDTPSQMDGYRILIDRLWPRGLPKEDAHIDNWIKEIAPSGELRRWFNHDPKRWQEFQERYRQELANNNCTILLCEIAARASQGDLTLLFAAKDTKHNNAVVVQSVLNEKFCQ